MSGCILFDLDGTLADTAADLIPSLNRIREEEGLEPLPFGRARSLVSHGAGRMVEGGFDLLPEDPRFEPLRLRLLDHYQRNLSTNTRLFPGMDELLESIEARGLRWGIVTNKSTRFTEPLTEALGLTGRCECIISGDTLPYSKPHPEPLLHACRICQAEPSASLYIGDAERDIEAGRRAGMTTIAALFGYLGPDDQPANWGADGMVESVAELSGWIERVYMA
jgi:2-phosphoglycolate phosphatase